MGYFSVMFPRTNNKGNIQNYIQRHRQRYYYSRLTIIKLLLLSAVRGSYYTQLVPSFAEPHAEQATLRAPLEKISAILLEVQVESRRLSNYLTEYVRYYNLYTILLKTYKRLA